VDKYIFPGIFTVQSERFQNIGKKCHIPQQGRVYILDFMGLPGGIQMGERQQGERAILEKLRTGILM
jgi:hypothetical protein